MRFSGLSYLVLGLAASGAVDAAPRLPGKQVNALAPRGIPESAAKLRFVPGYMKRAPKAKNDNKNNNNDNNEDVNIEITDITADIEVGGEEIQFEENVVQIMIKNSDNNKKKNDKRKKDVKNKNSKENVVIQVVQVIIEVSEDGSSNNRYAMSQLLADNGSDQTSTCMMTDAMTMTIGSGNCTGLGAVASGTNVLVASDGTATATAVMAMATAPTVGAPFNMDNSTMLLPAGSDAPAPADGVMVMADPAADLVSNDTQSCGL